MNATRRKQMPREANRILKAATTKAHHKKPRLDIALAALPGTGWRGTNEHRGGEQAARPR
jgi:hypothetical protein